MKKGFVISTIMFATLCIYSNAFVGIKENLVLLAKPEDGSKIFGITHDFPKFKNVAFAVKKDKKMFVQLNDKTSPEYSNIAAGTPVIAPETGTMAYIAKTLTEGFRLLSMVNLQARNSRPLMA